jgi:hypothetical protein
VNTHILSRRGEAKTDGQTNPFCTGSRLVAFTSRFVKTNPTIRIFNQKSLVSKKTKPNQTQIGVNLVKNEKCKTKPKYCVFNPKTRNLQRQLISAMAVFPVMVCLASASQNKAPINQPSGTPEKIDRQALVTRHNVIMTNVNALM